MINSNRKLKYSKTDLVREQLKLLERVWNLPFGALVQNLILYFIIFHRHSVGYASKKGFAQN